MSIGKNSIARAVNVTKEAPSTQKAQSNNVIIKTFSLDTIGLLTDTVTDDSINALIDSIRKRGLLSPVLVAITAKGDVWLIDGYNRFSAMKALKKEIIDAIVVEVQNKNDVNRLYKEISSAKQIINTDSIHEEKFKVLAVKDHDLPSYLL